MIPEQVKMYHRYNDLVREGDYYRIASFRANGVYDCYGVVKKDKSEALFTYVQVVARVNYHSRRIFLQGLAPDKKYRIEGEDAVYTGEVLMKAGYRVKTMHGDYLSRLIHITEV